MARPVNVMTFGAIRLQTPSDWSGRQGISESSPYAFTDVLQDYTLPNVRLTPVRIGVSRANYPIRGMLEDMTAAMTLSGHTVAVVGQVGAYLQFEFEAELEDDGAPGDSRVGLALVKGWCNAYDPGQVQGPYSSPQTAAIEIQVTKYKFSLPGLSDNSDELDNLYDIDLDTETYLRHGVSLWSALG